MTFKKTIVILLLICTAIALANRGKELSPEAKALSSILSKLKNDPDNRILQQRYISQFPGSRESFARLFDTEDFSELYDGYEYIRYLDELITAHPLQVGCILIHISTEAEWKADAFNYLQRTTAGFALNHIEIFIEILTTYESSEQEQLITFLAEGIHSPAHDYAEIVEKLQRMGEDALASKFTETESRIDDTRGH